MKFSGFMENWLKKQAVKYGMTRTGFIKALIWRAIQEEKKNDPNIYRGSVGGRRAAGRANNNKQKQ